MAEFDFGDEVVVSPGARSQHRPGSKGWIVALATPRRDLVTVEFEDGSSAGLPPDLVTKVTELTEFIVVYDYGTGGVWAVMSAPSRSVLESAYPDLIVREDRPPWMDQANYERIIGNSGFQYDRPNEYWRRFYRPS